MRLSSSSSSSLSSSQRARKVCPQRSFFNTRFQACFAPVLLIRLITSSLRFVCSTGHLARRSTLCLPIKYLRCVQVMSTQRMMKRAIADAIWISREITREIRSRVFPSACFTRQGHDISKKQYGNKVSRTSLFFRKAKPDDFLRIFYI